ncbi:MAG: GntR family transcriptional regulator [Firmicutes bacterium]|nr:GntR family transcriptional regulator [Bacillota bacterium]
MAVRIQAGEEVRSVPQPLADELFVQLRRDILQGKFQVGEKLPEQRICDEYNVSRTPVRDAFRQLEREGLLTSQPNRGTVVRGLTARDRGDLYELRKLCEVFAVRLAIERATPEGLAALGEAFEFMEFYTQRKDPEKMLNINMEFHRLIHEMAQSAMLFQVLQSCQAYVLEIRSENPDLDDHLTTVLEEHRQIYEAFLSGDAEKGAQAMSLHLTHARNRAGV